MIILIKLILAHFIGDFLLQPKSWVLNKEINKIKSRKLYLHIIIHGLLILILFWDLSYWLLAITVMMTHGLIDLIKVYLQKEKTKPQWFIVDQILHMISLLLIWIWWFEPAFELKSWWSNQTFWIFATALVFITVVTGVVIQILMSAWSQAIADDQEESLKNAGKYIGILERLFVFTFIVTGHWEAVGFLIAAKSVFRFGDLKESKDRKLTEYILIGTLISFGVAIGTGLIVNYLVPTI